MSKLRTKSSFLVSPGALIQPWDGCSSRRNREQRTFRVLSFMALQMAGKFFQPAECRLLARGTSFCSIPLLSIKCDCVCFYVLGVPREPSRGQAPIVLGAAPSWGESLPQGVPSSEQMQLPEEGVIEYTPCPLCSWDVSLLSVLSYSSATGAAWQVL